VYLKYNNKERGRYSSIFHRIKYFIMKRDIENLEDIKLMVDSFYTEVRKSPLIGPIFAQVVQDNWPPHLQKMYNFWQTILLHEQAYKGSPFPPHANLPVQKAHFDEWIRLFGATIDNLFEGVVAEDAKMRAEKMAIMFNSKIDYYRQNPGTFPII
jgi:hemoglobin